jgi:hypothetical protein
VPIFVLLGCILDQTGMGKAIVDFLASLLGHVKAGMSYVLLCSLFRRIGHFGLQGLGHGDGRAGALSRDETTRAQTARNDRAAWRPARPWPTLCRRASCSSCLAR